jgi:hypothetical protein
MNPIQEQCNQSLSVRHSNVIKVPHFLFYLVVGVSLIINCFKWRNYTVN